MLLLIACHSVVEGTVLVSDSGRNRIVWMDARTGEAVQERGLADLFPDVCIGESPDLSCVPFSIVGIDDDAVLLIDAQDDTQNYQSSVLARLDPQGAVLWHVNTFDFSAFPEACTLDPCSPNHDDASCGLVQAHDADVSEQDGAIRAVVADTANDRVVFISAQSGDTCGTVTDLLSADTVSDWGAVPNDVDLVPLPDGREGVLVTFREGVADVGAPQGGGEVALFVPGTDGWTRAWRFPSEGYLNSPHDASLHGTQPAHLILAHSNGAGAHLQEDWTRLEDGFGSVTVARLDDVLATPDYRYDVVAKRTPFGFLRSVRPWDDKNWVIADSGCMSNAEDCPRDAAVRFVPLTLDDATNGTGTGAFVEGRTEQTDLVVLDRIDPLLCGFSVPFAAVSGTAQTANTLTTCQ